MSSSPILRALDRLNDGIGALETAVVQVESKIKAATARGKKRDHQMDLFAPPPAMSSGVASSSILTGKGIDPEDVARRISRVIDQIETVLAEAA